MKKILMSFILLAFFISIKAQDITIYDCNGNSAAFIDNELTIYLWNGKPTSYLLQESNETHIYDFNGNHIGWYEEGIFYDSEGDVVGFFENATNVVVSNSTIQGIKQITPIKSIEEIAPIQPILGLSCSKTPLSIFLSLGTN